MIDTPLSDLLAAPLAPAPLAPTFLSPALLFAWLEQSHDLLALTDAAGRARWSNAVFARATGLSGAFDMLDLAPPDWHDGAPRRIVLAALQTGAAEHTEVMLLGSAAQPLRASLRVSRVGDERLWTLKDLGISHADTEQRARRLEAATDAARIGIWTSVVGTRQAEWNAQMYELFGMVGARVPPTLGEWVVRCVHADDAVWVKQVMRAHVRGETAALQVEFRIRMGDGRVRWIMLCAGHDRSGADTSRTFGIAMDVTDRHDALTALHAASQRSALIAQHTGIGTWETDASGLPAQWDDQMFRLRGLEPRPGALERDERMALVHPDDRARVIDANEDINAVNQTTGYEFRVRLPDGSYRWLASRSATLRDEYGKIARRVGVNWDVSEAKGAELARQQALLAERESQAKSQFLSRMSHELRTPLNAVLGFTQLLQIEAQQSSAPLRLDKLAHIRRAGEHLLTLIDDALDLTRLAAGTLRLDLQPVALDIAVAQALPLVEELATAHEVTLHHGPLVGTVRADPTRLRQVLLNLLTNAIKYNLPGGRVTIATTLAGGDVHLSVSDNGRGMRPDQLAQLFEPFNRLGLERETIEGSGIGLTIVKALVENMGGRIVVSSQPGRGTVFDAALPAADAHGPSEVTTDATVIARPAAAGRRSGQLLYIEDNSVNVLLVEELVKSMPGLQIASEPTGAAGVARAGSLQPDVVLVDLQLPDFDGFEVLRRLRADPATAHLRCIALSANGMPDDIQRGLAGGFDDYWTKPIKFKPFLEALERMFPLA